MAQNRQANRRAGRVQVVWLVCLLGAVAYAMYAYYTQTGLAGYAMKIQMDLWGSASEGTTVMLTLGAVVIVLFALWPIAERVFPSLRNARADAAHQFVQPSLTWKWLTVICVAPLLIGGVVSASWYRSAHEDANAQVYSIDLRSAPAVSPKNARFLEVTGAIARPYVLVYKKTEDQKVTHEVFAPLIGQSEREPIRYVVHNEATESYDGQANWPDVFRQKGAAPFSGRVGRGLPAYVVSGLRAKGAVLDPSYAVIEWKDLRYRQFGGGLGSDDPWFTPLAVGGLLSVFLIPMMLVVKFGLKRVNRRQQAAGL